MPGSGSARGRPGPTILRMIHEVDELLEKLVKKDALNGSSVELVFDAPTKDWVARRNGPAVDLYLYDIREDLQRRVPIWEDVRDTDGTVKARGMPPRRFKLSYLVTAWTQRPEDEHRLLSALLSAFIRKNSIPSGISTSCSIAQLDAAARVSTKVVAIPMPSAVSSFPDTPINGQSPRNFTSTTLFTNAVPRINNRYSVT